MARFKKILRVADFRRILGITDDDKVDIVAVEVTNDPIRVSVIVQDQTPTNHDHEARLMHAPVVADALVEHCGESHYPVQHRDGKPPWCNLCGRDGLGVLWSANAADQGRPALEKEERLNVMVNAFLNRYSAPGFTIPDPTRTKSALLAALQAGRIDL